MSAGIVIAGGGLAAQRCAETLRRCGYEGAIRIVCGEPHHPYDRPALSKEALGAETLERSLRFRSDDWYEHNNVELLLGTSARALDHRARVLHLGDGSRLRYSSLLIATGARPRELPMFRGAQNACVLRTLEDAAALREALASGSRLLVIGAGFIGQEVASAARSAGVSTTIVEAAPAPLAPLLGARLGAWFAELHRSQGVDVVLHEQVTGVRAERRSHEERHIRSVALASGRTIECEHVLVGVGVTPDLDWLAGSPLDRRGVRTDADGRTEIADVYAAGDAAAAFDPALGRHVVEGHWESAGRQGVRAAKAILGIDPGTPAPASFWSDLYGTRIRYLGHAPAADDVTFDGDPRSREFAATFTRAGRPVAVLLVDRPQMLPHARALLTDAAPEMIAA
jgi:3-phenylpropionate/trans-cinnamate dioxygenase ferredoxin reductase subunit